MPESIKVGYEVLCRPCTQEEKEAIIQVNIRFLMCFGVKPPYENWEQYERYYNTMLRSDKLLRMGEAGYDLVAGLSVPNSTIGSYVNQYLKWMTYAMMPQRLTVQFYGRKMTRIDYIFLALALGRIRFLYRFLPTWLRHVGPYHFMARRVGVREHSALGDRLIDWFNVYIDRALKAAFKERSKDEVEALLEEARRKRFEERLHQERNGGRMAA